VYDLDHPQWICFDFEDVTIAVGQDARYWIVIDASSVAAQHAAGPFAVGWGDDQIYAEGKAMYSDDSGQTWKDLTGPIPFYDFNFHTYSCN
jgi:hypothetical protein